MYWNYQVSLIFSGLFVLTNSYYWKKRPRYWKEYLLFGTFYLIMELFQTTQWLYGNVYDRSLSIGIEKCDSVNRNFTLVAHTLIWLQPIMFSYIGYHTNSNKKIFGYFHLMNWIVLLYSLIVLYIGLDYHDYYHIDNSIYGLSTCTNKGQTGHLVWKFKPYTIDYFPNYFMYLFLCVLSFVMYDKLETKIIGVGWFVSLVVTKIVLQPSVLELASSWCLLSIVGNFIIYGYLHLEQIMILC